MQRRRGYVLTGQPLCPRLRLEVVWSRAVLGDLANFWFGYVCLSLRHFFQTVVVWKIQTYHDNMYMYTYIYRDNVMNVYVFFLSFGRDCF